RRDAFCSLQSRHSGTPPAVAQDQKREQSLKAQGRNHKQINGRDRLRVVPERTSSSPATATHLAPYISTPSTGRASTPRHGSEMLPTLGSSSFRRMRSRNSRSIFGRPARFRDFQRENATALQDFPIWIRC